MHQNKQGALQDDGGNGDLSRWRFFIRSIQSWHWRTAKKSTPIPQNKGRDVEVITTDERTITGPMQEVTEENITVVTSEGKGKKLVVKEEVIPFEIIKQTKVLIKF